MIEENISNVMPDVIEAEPIVTEEDEDIMPEIPVKETINPDEIFKKPTKKEKVEVKDDDKDVIPKIKPVRKKRVMTQEALDNLAKARAKANAKRSENARLRKEQKDQGVVKPAITKKERADYQEKVEKERPIIHQNITNNITPEDINKIAVEASSKATAKALQEYETIRKARKAEKKKAQAVHKEKEVIQNKINTALGRKYGEQNFFDNCF
tara:strand:+ start:337 stop:969 length:633 start_codon:yes stop_codon:yes gene_type:complete